MVCSKENDLTLAKNDVSNDDNKQKPNSLHESKTSTREDKPTRFEAFFLIIGSIGLLTSFLTDSFAVLGRHSGIPLIGSIEVVQASIVFFASTAIVAATLSHQHAKVQLLTERVSPSLAKTLSYISSYISAFYCLLLFVGTVWIIAETWLEHERSELLHIPFTELRLILAATLFLLSLYFLLRPASLNDAIAKTVQTSETQR